MRFGDEIPWSVALALRPGVFGIDLETGRSLAIEQAIYQIDQVRAIVIDGVIENQIRLREFDGCQGHRDVVLDVDRKGHDFLNPGLHTIRRTMTV